MKHTLTSNECSDENVKFEIYVLELNSDLLNIGIERKDFLKEHLNNEISINLNKKELHSFIGTLLHAQSKMRGGSNG